MGSQRALFMMTPTRAALLPAAFLLLLLATTARAQPRQARRDGGEVKEETTTSSSQVSSTTTKETMVEEEANEVIDPMEQCSKCRKAAYTYKKKFFCQKCVKEGHLKEADTVVNCDKCRKPRYRARNGDFCGQECPDTSAGGMVDNAAINTIEPTVVTTVVDDETPELGVLGHIFKFLVQANTWGEVPANIPVVPSPVAASAATGETEEEEQ